MARNSCALFYQPTHSYHENLFSSDVFDHCKISATSFSGYSQEITIHKTDTPLKEVLQSLEIQTDFTFFYNNKFVDDQVKVSLNVENVSIEHVLNTLLKRTFIKYRIINKNIVLFTEDDAATLAKEMDGQLADSKVQVIEQDKIQVKGTVYDSDGMPLPGVNILVQGTGSGTQTDFDGNYSISVSLGEVLVFSYIGMKSATKKVTPETKTINITLATDTNVLNEVIVVAYDKQSKTSYTGSAVDIDISKVKETPMASFQESLQGNVAGVQMVTQSGQPGAAPDVRIRGIGSINAGSEPLYVIDGIPVVAGNISQIATSSNTIAGINSKDIATITVLKDASATAIYGSRGANGVILITTKKGKTGKTRFDFSSQYGISSMILPDRNKPLNTAELSELLIESRVNIGDSQADAEAYIYSRINEEINTDWVDVISRDAQYSQYNLSASGGDDKTNFYASLGLFDQEAVIIGVDYKKLNAKVNLSHKATDKLKIDIGLAANHQKLHTNNDAGDANNPVRAMFRVVPWESVYNADGSYNTNILLTYNPVGLVKENIRESKLYGIIGNLGLTYDFNDNLSFETKGNIDFNLADEFQYDNPYFGAGRNDGGRGRAYNNKIINYNITNLLKYKWQVNDSNRFNFMIGQEAQKIERSSVFAYASNYGAPGLTSLENASVYREASSSITASALASYFFNVNYALKERYFFNVTARRDGSSRFGQEVRYANFGSVGLAWNVSSESFLKNADFIKKLKFRTSYGINGNQEIGDFASRGLYETGEDYNGEPGYIYAQQSNPRLTWEKNKPFNVGVDFNLFNRISGTVEYYSRQTTDLLFRVPISSTNGLTSYLANIGEMKNHGWELALNTVNVENPEGFGWTTDINFTTNTNEITKLQNDEPIISGQYIREVGDDFYMFYMPGYAGVNPDNGEALWYKDASKTETTNRYSEARPFKQGSALPKFYAGLTNTFTYKNIGFSFMWYLNYGNKVYDFWGRFTGSDGSARLNDRGNMARRVYDNRWQQPGDITDIPKMVWGNTQSGSSSQHSTRFLYDGTYLRLRDVTLSYSLPESVIEKLNVSNLRFYVKAANMLTWTKDKNIEVDPEVGIDGQSNLRIPMSKQLLLGVDFSF